MAEYEKTITFGDFIEPMDLEDLDLSSTLRLRAKSIDRKKLWESKDRSAEFMGDIWSLFVDPSAEKRIRTVLHSICVELIENAVKYIWQGHDCIITVNLCLKSDELLLYVVNKSDLSHLQELEAAIRFVLESDKPLNKLFKQKMKEAKAAKAEGQRKSQLGLIRIMMQDVKLAWQIQIEGESAIVTTLARIPLHKTEALHEY